MRRHKPTGILHFAFCIVLLLLSSCSVFGSNPTPTLTASATALPTGTPTVIPTETATTTPIPARPRALYQLAATIDYAAHSLTVAESILYPNHTGQTLNSLVLAVVPNLWADCFVLNSVAVDDVPVTDFSINGQRLDLNLPSPLVPEQTITLLIHYSLALPFAEQEDPTISRPRIFGYTRAQMNLTNWYPFVVPFINGDWVLHEPWVFGEHLVYDAADFEVNVGFVDSAHIPVVATSGEMQGIIPLPGQDFTTYTLTAGRAFALSASPEFKVASQQEGEVTISSYYFPFNDGAGQATLQAAAQALQIFGERYGPYPHKTLAVVMGDFNDGMEFSAFFYLSRDFYNLYNSAPSPVNYLIFVAAHETAHQWWFDQVGNDQAIQPWLDESLATYSERVYYEATNPKLVATWWAYRVDYYQPQGFVDIPIYDGQGFRLYTNAVYFRGAHFLEELRTRIGDEAFFAFLQDYVSQERGHIATTADFFRILHTHTQADFTDIVRHYFQNVY
ncbi:MAG TPA: M1 family metallopeptidase [Anaerolineales bacterium]|jgi:hypothetical protein